MDRLGRKAQRGHVLQSLARRQARTACSDPYSASTCAGYKSVAHYLVLTHQAEAEVPQADSASAAAPAESATASAGAKGDPALEQPAAGKQAHAVEPDFRYLLTA